MSDMDSVVLIRDLLAPTIEHDDGKGFAFRDFGVGGKGPGVRSGAVHSANGCEEEDRALRKP